MAGLIPRRLTGTALQLSARAGRLPVVASTVRAGVREQVGLSVLRDARLGATVVPMLRPPAPDRPGPSPDIPDPAA